MNIRPLTADEKALIKRMKDAVNLDLKIRRRKINHQIKELRSSKVYAQRDINDLRNQKDALPSNITGEPVKVLVEGEPIHLDYKLLRQVAIRLPKSKWDCSVHLKNGCSLVIDYKQPWPNNGSGQFELYGLPFDQVQLLKNLRKDLPEIEIAEEVVSYVG